MAENKLISIPRLGKKNEEPNTIVLLPKGYLVDMMAEIFIQHQGGEQPFSILLISKKTGVEELIYKNGEGTTIP
ncbi:hypothetical protein [Sphingobacterium rhinopitheci]|uniref:hypothetical protein n=1 Tax=Sphingobacterium rhinopitheci TaxID=2781960 RepID=UPI001F521B47|nr:hypothetical protein [Sphingobacterium rhinopitheci]